MSDGLTYDARVYRTEVYKGKAVTTYHVGWKVGGKLWREGFRTAAQADSFRSALLTASGKVKRSAWTPAGQRPGSERRPTRPGTSSPVSTWT